LSGVGASIDYQYKDINIKLAMAKTLEKPDSIYENSANYFTINYKF
jgi:hypothetical protein